MSAFPEIAQLVPHAAPMLLLSRVVQHDGERTLCEAETQQSAVENRKNVVKMVTTSDRADRVIDHPGESEFCLLG